MRNLQIIGNVPQVRRESNLGEYAEEAVIIEEPVKPKRVNHFIEANTQEVSLSHLKNDCITPVFAKDNELTVNHAAFIETVWEAANSYYNGETIGTPNIRVSHVIKGRIPEAIHKPANQLLESDKTIYYERAAFSIDIPTIYETVEGNKLNLSIVGVRAYNQMNLYSKKVPELFRLAIGFKNQVCCNMCIFTDGYKDDLRVSNTSELYRSALELFNNYNGYQKDIPRMLFTDTQVNNVARAYINDENFGSLGSDLSMWEFFNLLTGACKTHSYIDSFLDRAVNATEIATGINAALHGDTKYKWFID